MLPSQESSCPTLDKCKTKTRISQRGSAVGHWGWGPRNWNLRIISNISGRSVKIKINKLLSLNVSQYRQKIWLANVDYVNFDLHRGTGCLLQIDVSALFGEVLTWMVLSAGPWGQQFPKYCQAFPCRKPASSLPRDVLFYKEQRFIWKLGSVYSSVW